MFLKAYQIKSVLSEHAQLAFKYWNCLGQEKNYIKNFCFSFPFCHWTICSSVHLLLNAGKILVIARILGGFRYNISDHRLVPFFKRFHGKIAALKHLKRVTGRIFTICKWFHRSKKKLLLDILHKRQLYSKLWKPSAFMQEVRF